MKLTYEREGLVIEYEYDSKDIEQLALAYALWGLLNHIQDGHANAMTIDVLRKVASLTGWEHNSTEEELWEWHNRMYKNPNWFQNLINEE
jgi:hypothetical protein